MTTEKIDLIKCLVKQGRLINGIKQYFSYGLSLLTGNVSMGGYPPIVMIEPTNLCNLKCPLCPSGNGTLKRSKGFMDLQLFKKIIDEIYAKTAMIILWNQGEPFLHKDIIEMIEYCNAKGLFTMTSTNANIFPDPQKLVKSGLDTLIISLDGLTQKTYNKYRVNGDVNKVFEHTKSLVAAKRRLNKRKPLIKWQFLVMKHNENEIVDIKQAAHKIGVDSISFKTAQIYKKSDIAEFLPQSSKYRRYKIQNDDFTLKKKIANRCRRIFTQPVINWDGEMAICCFDKDNEYKIGNVKQNSLLSLWQSEKMNNIRQMILNDRKKLPVCLNCGEGVKLTIGKK